MTSHFNHKYSINDLKWLWVEWLRSLNWDNPLKEEILHRTWKPECQCFICWLERNKKK